MRTGRGSERTPSTSATAPPPVSSPSSPSPPDSASCWAPHTSWPHRLQGGRSPPLPRRPAPCSPELPAYTSPSRQLHSLQPLGASRLPAWLLAQASPSTRSCPSPTQHPGPLPLAQPRAIPQPRPLLPSEPAQRGGTGPRGGKRGGEPPRPLEMMAPPQVSLGKDPAQAGECEGRWSRHQNDMPGACSSQPRTAPSSALIPPCASHRPGQSHQTLGHGQHTARRSQTLTGRPRPGGEDDPSSSHSSCSPGRWARLSRSDLTQRL